MTLFCERAIKLTEQANRRQATGNVTSQRSWFSRNVEKPQYSSKPRLSQALTAYLFSTPSPLNSLSCTYPRVLSRFVGHFLSNRFKLRHWTITSILTDTSYIRRRTIYKGKPEIPVENEMIHGTPFSCDLRRCNFSTLFQFVQLNCIYFVADHSSTMSNFTVSCLCTWFPTPGGLCNCKVLYMSVNCNIRKVNSMTKYSTRLLKLVPWILKHHVERSKTLSC